MSIASDVMAAIETGLQYFDDIAVATNYTSQQVYDATRWLIRDKKVESVIGGHHGAVVLPGQKLIPKCSVPTVPVSASETKKVVESKAPFTKPVTSPIASSSVKEPFTVDFDFNSHFDSFIEKMTHAVVDQIQQRVSGELSKLSTNMGDQIVNMVRISSEGMIDRISNQLADAVKAVNDLKVDITSASIGQQPPKQPVVEQQKVRLPKICIAGMKPIHAGQLSAEFSDTFDIVFWNDRTGSSNKQLQDYSHNCEAVFWHTNHSSHSGEGIVKKANGNLIRVSGTLTAMRNAITEYYCNSKNTA